MTNLVTLGILMTIALSGVGVVADVCLKAAGVGPRFLDPQLFVAGLVLYGASACGWFYAMKWLKLSIIGVLYPILTMLLLVAAGVFVFEERLTMREYLGIAAALVSVGLLGRFS